MSTLILHCTLLNIMWCSHLPGIRVRSSYNSCEIWKKMTRFWSISVLEPKYWFKVICSGTHIYLSVKEERSEINGYEAPQKSFMFVYTTSNKIVHILDWMDFSRMVIKGMRVTSLSSLWEQIQSLTSKYCGKFWSTIEEGRNNQKNQSGQGHHKNTAHRINYLDLMQGHGDQRAHGGLTFCICYAWVT